jgi:hypothetical protein
LAGAWREIDPVSFRRLVLLLPIVFVAHVLEEAPGFVPWFNSVVSRGITQPLFLSVNVAAFLMTLFITLLAVVSPAPGTGVVLAAWVGFLVLANGLFHLVATVVLARYCPGVVTGTLLYLPLGFVLLRAVVRELHVSGSVVATAAGLGAVPMLLHGFLIVFRGSRLF